VHLQKYNTSQFSQNESIPSERYYDDTQSVWTRRKLIIRSSVLGSACNVVPGIPLSPDDYYKNDVVLKHEIPIREYAFPMHGHQFSSQPAPTHSFPLVFSIPPTHGDTQCCAESRLKTIDLNNWWPPSRLARETFVTHDALQ